MAKNEIHAIRNAYSRGYNAAATNKWSQHKPPFPPEPLVRSLMKAAMELRDAVDGQLAHFEPDDPLEAALGPKIQEVDEAFAAISKWLKQPPTKRGDQP